MELACLLDRHGDLVIERKSIRRRSVICHVGLATHRAARERGHDVVLAHGQCVVTHEGHLPRARRVRSSHRSESLCAGDARSGVAVGQCRSRFEVDALVWNVEVVDCVGFRVAIVSDRDRVIRVEVPKIIDRDIGRAGCRAGDVRVLVKREGNALIREGRAGLHVVKSSGEHQWYIGK